MGTWEGSKRLKALCGKVLTLGTSPKKNYKETRAIKADVAAVIVSHYAVKGSEVAGHSFCAIVSIGINSYIQGTTGWLPKTYQSSPEARQTLSHIL